MIPVFQRMSWFHRWTLQLVLVAFGGLLTALMPTSTAHAATYYVATTGNNSNAGTEAKPWRTVAYAVSKMVAGDTTYVRGGVYNEINIRFSKSGTQQAPIKLLNYPNESPVIDFGVDFTNRLVQRINIFAPKENVPIGWITIEGFEIRHGYEAIKFGSAHNLTIRRNRFHDNINSAMLGFGKDILIDRNAIYSNGPKDRNRVHGLYLTGSNYVITNNLIYESGAYGIQVAGYPWDMLEYTEHPIDRKLGPDPSYAGAANWIIANNTLAYNGSSGIVLWRKLTVNCRIFNNIFYENSVKSKIAAEGVNGVTLISSGGMYGNEIKNNVFYNSRGIRMFANGREGINYTQSDNITANPNFVNAPASLPSSPSFVLRQNSPAIGGGLNLFSLGVTMDFTGKGRPQKGPFDRGAYQFASSPVSAVPSSPSQFTVK